MASFFQRVADGSATCKARFTLDAHVHLIPFGTTQLELPFKPQP